MQASEARQLASHALGGSPGPRGYAVCLSSGTEDEDEPHQVTDAEAADARAAEAAAAHRFGGPDHPEPLYMPGASTYNLTSHMGDSAHIALANHMLAVCITAPINDRDVLSKLMCMLAGRVLWMIPPEEATEDNLSSTDVSLAATPVASPRSSLEEVRRRLWMPCMLYRQ